MALTRLVAGKDSGLRSDRVEGWCEHLPRLGEPFCMVAPALVDPGEGRARAVTTSVVTALAVVPFSRAGFDVHNFTTASGSRYQVVDYWEVKKVEPDNAMA